MESNRFFQKLSEVSPLVNNYAFNFFEISKYGSFKESLEKVNHKDFISKCYEGFKIAQDKLIENILEIESEIEKIKSEINEYERGKKKSSLKDDSHYLGMNRQKNDLIFQRASFRELANVIVWTIFLEQRTDIKSFIKLSNSDGYLKDRDIENCIKVARQINNDSNTFALITDITSTLHVGDLIVVEEGKISVTEVKRDTKINNLISNIVEYPKDPKDTKIFLEELIQTYGVKGVKQLQRNMRQMIRMHNIKEYIEKDEVFDFDLNQKKYAFEVSTPDIDFMKFLEMALDEFYKHERKMFVFPTDCCFVGIVRKNGEKSEIAFKLDFKHDIYHRLFKNWDECAFSNKDKPGFTKENIPEMFLYHKLDIYSFKDKVFFPAQRPLFLSLKQEYVIDLLTDKIAIYIYFDPDRLIEMAKERKLKMEFVKKTSKIKDHPYKNEFPFFEKGYMQVSNKETKLIIGYGIILRIVYELQSGYNLIEHLKEDLKKI